MGVTGMQGKQKTLVLSTIACQQGSGQFKQNCFSPNKTQTHLVGV